MLQLAAEHCIYIIIYVVMLVLTAILNLCFSALCFRNARAHGRACDAYQSAADTHYKNSSYPHHDYVCGVVNTVFIVKDQIFFDYTIITVSFTQESKLQDSRAAVCFPIFFLNRFLEQASNVARVSDNN